MQLHLETTMECNGDVLCQADCDDLSAEKQAMAENEVMAENMKNLRARKTNKEMHDCFQRLLWGSIRETDPRCLDGFCGEAVQDEPVHDDEDDDCQEEMMKSS